MMAYEQAAPKHLQLNTYYRFAGTAELLHPTPESSAGVNTPSTGGISLDLAITENRELSEQSQKELQPLGATNTRGLPLHILGHP